MLVIFILFSLAGQVFAAELFFETKTPEIAINQLFEAEFFLNTEEEYINAVEGKILFSGDLLELKEVKEGNSIVNLWIERPKAKPDNQIIFSGIIPGGYTGKEGLIFSLIFQTKNEGEGAIEIYDAKTLLNNGKGTPAQLSISNFQFLISEQATQVPITPTEDTDPPEKFNPMIAKDPEIFNGKYFLVFATQDKNSGISHYEVLEAEQEGSFLKLIKEDKWQVGESPYLLEDQKLKSYNYVKAVDKAGNERIADLPPQNPLEWYENYYIWGKIIISIILIYAIWRILKKKRFYMPVC